MYRCATTPNKQFNSRLGLYWSSYLSINVSVGSSWLQEGPISFSSCCPGLSSSFLFRSRTLLCCQTQLQLDVEVPLSRHLIHSFSRSHTVLAVPRLCISFSIPAHVHFGAVIRKHKHTHIHTLDNIQTEVPFCNSLWHNCACSRTAVTQWTVRSFWQDVLE